MRTKEQIIREMTNEMPYPLATSTEPYILEAMEIYATEAAKTTERRLFAAMAMQGMMADTTQGIYTFDGAAYRAVQFADALIKELNKPQI